MYVLVSAMFLVPSKFIFHSLAYLVEMAVDSKISQSAHSLSRQCDLAEIRYLFRGEGRGLDSTTV